MITNYVTKTENQNDTKPGKALKYITGKEASVIFCPKHYSSNFVSATNELSRESDVPCDQT